MPKKDVGYLIKNINDKLKVRADADLKSYNLTFSQSRVLAFLNEKGGEATQKEIEVFLEVSHPTVVGIISRMEQNGFLTTEINCNDRRNKVVMLTEKAKGIGADLEKHMSENEKNLLARLSADESEQLKKLLLTVYASFE